MKSNEHIKHNETAEEQEETVTRPSLPWYRRIFSTLHPKTDTGFYLGMVLLFFCGMVIARFVPTRQSVVTKAGTDTVKISVQPSTTSMPPNTAFQIWATADNPVSFMTIRIIFDPTLIQLSGEVTTTPSPLTRIVKKTSMTEANTTGIVSFSLALDPAFRTTPPTGTFQLAILPFSTKTTVQNVSTSIHLDTGAMQVINPNGTLFTITTVDSTLTLNRPTPTPTRSTPTPTVTPTITPTRAPITPAPPIDTIAPSISITNPIDGSVVMKNIPVSITTVTSDNVGVTNVDILVNGKTQCKEVTSTYTCVWTPRGKTDTKNVISVKAYDAAGNIGSASISVTMK